MFYSLLPLLVKFPPLITQNSGIEKAFLFDAMSKIYIATDSSPVDIQTYELCSDMIDVIIDISCIYGMPPKQLLAREENSDSFTQPEFVESGGSAYSYIKLSNGIHLYFREVSRHLALVCLFRGDGSALAEKRALVEYNFNCFRESLHKVFAIDPSIYHYL
jgi:Ras-related GTP-binding protein C/D